MILTRIIRLCAAATLIAGTGIAALPKLPPETMALIDSARSLPPEFSADLLLDLAASPAVPQPEWRRQLIGEAFAVAPNAQLPHKKRGERTTDARASRAYWPNGLDALTLETTAVRAMLVIDPQKARVMFEDIPTPQVPALSCQETGAPDLSVYYQTARELFTRSFTPAQREKEEHLRFLENIVGHMQSPAHVTQAVRLIYQADLTSAQRRELVGVLAGMLGRINGTPRIFGNSTFQLVPASAPVKMPAGIRSADPLLPSGEGELPLAVLDGVSILIPALRAYIVRHVSGPRCTEEIKAGALPLPVSDFNYFVSKLDPTGTLYTPVSLEEARPAKDAGTYEKHLWWQSPRSKQVLNALQWLNHGNRDLPDDKRFFTDEERTSAEWNAHYVDTVRLIEGWNATEEASAEDWFGMVSEAYALIAEKVPPADKPKAVERLLNFMETQYASIESHNLWFTQLHGLWQSRDPAIRDQFAASSNPVISAYTKVNRLHPR